MGDETTIVEYIETQDGIPGDGLLRTSCKLSSAGDIPNETWFETGISKKIKSVLKSGFMSDLTVRLQDENVQCHSFVIGVASSKLAAMLSKNQHEMKLPGVKSDTFKILLQIIYCEEADEIKTDVEKMLDVMKVANELNVYTAVTYCNKLLRDILDASNVCSILDLAFLVDHLELKEACTKVIREQTGEVLKSDGFLKCEVATLEHILKQEFVCNITELGLFQAAVRWSKTHKNPREALGTNLSLIRFRTFSTEDIAAYVKPAKLLSTTEEQELLWYLLAKGKGEMPAGFSNEMGERHITFSVEHFRESTEEIDLCWCGAKYVTAEELLATPPLRISVNEDAFLIGVKPETLREGKNHGDKYMEDVEVTLKDDKGNLIATATFRGEVIWNSSYDVKFPHAVQLCADVTYELHFSHNVPGVRQRTVNQKKQVCNTKTSLRINVLEEQYSLIYFLLIAPKSV